MIAEIIINNNSKELNRTFDYNIPKELEEKVKIGSRVLIPFGNMKKLEDGFVIGFKETSNYKLKDISKICDENILNKQKVELSKWMSKRYFGNLSEAIKLMLPAGTLTKSIENRTKEKTGNFVDLKKDIEEIEFEIETGKLKSEKQIRLLRFLIDNGETYISDLEAFTEVSKAIMKTLEKNGYIEIYEKQIERNPFINKEIKRDKKLNLTEEQQEAYNKIEEAIEDQMDSEFLIFGVTGSGKTEIYLQLIEKVYNENKSSIVLVPEISLTPQMVNRFIARFGQDKIAVLHSKLSVGERYDEWYRIKNGKAKIVIGARSAIFAPVEDLGLIIIDEEHDSSYKSEGGLRYDAKEVAKMLSRQNSCPLVLGSATPEMKSYYKALKGDIELIELTKRAGNANIPEVEIIDLREELAKGNRSMISTKLHEEIEENLKNKHQTILFLNRRGYSTFVMCRDCGYTVKCKNCDITMTYHLKQNKLKCHYCGYEETKVEICPECGSKNIRYFGTGTQKLEEEIHKLFPNASTIRMDIDTVTKKNSHEEILNKFKEENIDILIGTQMIVKGHHFPNVTLVGVIAADSSLNIEDYRANERTFQILTQVAGRAGREKLPGNVIIQTYNPDSIAIENAAKQDYKSFYDIEVALRKQLKYPPFCDIIVIGVNSSSKAQVANITSKLHKYLKNRIINEKIGLLLYSPVPAPIDKIKNKYRWRIIIKCIYNEQINKLVQDALEEGYKETKNTDTRIVVDLNPNNMM